jgi:small subunit ribosomal protein S20
MANTKSAAKRARQSLKRRELNKARKSRIKTLEKKYLRLLNDGKKEEAVKVFSELTSAFDKAVKVGTIHSGKANRKKSRLALYLSKASAKTN